MWSVKKRLTRLLRDATYCGGVIQCSKTKDAKTSVAVSESWLTNFKLNGFTLLQAKRQEKENLLAGSTRTQEQYYRGYAATTGTGEKRQESQHLSKVSWHQNIQVRQFQAMIVQFSQHSNTCYRKINRLLNWNNNRLWKLK